MRLILVVVAAAVLAQEPIRTADITVRGLKPADFPRITKLATNVYAYEQIDPTKRIVTANNLIVVSNEGVLVVEGQGTVDNVKRLVADIATLTRNPSSTSSSGPNTATTRAATPRFLRRPPFSCIRFRRLRSSDGLGGRQRPWPRSA
jgi:hypothetical protein